MSGARSRKSRRRKREVQEETPPKTLDSYQEVAEIPSAESPSSHEVPKEGTSPHPKAREAGHPSPGRASTNIRLMERSPSVSGVDAAVRTDLLGSIRPPGKVLYDIMAVNILPSEVLPFLGNLSSLLREKRAVGIYFHNDMDGLNGALIVRSMVQLMAPDGLDLHAYPVEYNELKRIKLGDEMVYVFIDMDLDVHDRNVFRIDHHHHERDFKLVQPNVVLLSPPLNDYLYPSTSTGLCAYLDHVQNGGELSYLKYLSSGPWHNEPFTRAMMLLSSVCDNLWHLNFIIDIPIKRWIPDPEEERNLILVSISASLLLGSDERRKSLMDSFFHQDLTLQSYMGTLCSQLIGARNLLSFAETVSSESEGFYNRIFFNLTDSIDRALSSLERDKDMLRKLIDSMPIEMRGNREKMMELLKTKGDQSDRHWKRIEFYGKQLEKLESKIKVEEKRLMKLRSAKTMFATEKGPKLCISVPRQISGQVKGILASLLYYKGWKNVTLEDRGTESFWGARGFTEEAILDYLSTLSLGFEDLKDYLTVERVFKDLPDVFKRTHNISKNVSFSKSYSGGLGGRGLIYGGVFKGKVPWIFSLLEESGDAEEKIKELMLHKELGSAMQGLTEGQSNVPTITAIRAKFKATGWLVVTLIPGKEGADVLLGNFDNGVMSLVGYNELFKFNLVEQAPPSVPMDHQVFDVVD